MNFQGVCFGFQLARKQSEFLNAVTNLKGANEALVTLALSYCISYVIE